MLCKKCKTAIYDKTKSCGYCGARPPEVIGFKLVMSGLLSVIIIMGCGGYIYLNANGYFQLDEGNKIDEIAYETENPQALESEIPSAYQQAISQQGDLIAQSTEAPTDNSDDTGEYAAVWSMLENIEVAVTQFAYQNDVETDFISQNGYFYDYNRQKYIKVSDLAQNGFLPDQISDGQVLLLYMKPSDFRGYKEVNFGFSPELKIFVGYETKSGIALYSNGKKGIVYREHFNEILSYYKVVESEVFSPKSDSNEFTSIINSIMSNELDNEGYDVRYIKMDDYYAVVVFSYISDPTKLHGYVLSRIDGEFKVVVRQYEQYSDYIERINNEVVTFDFHLMPDTALDAFTLYGHSKYLNIINELEAKEYVLYGDNPLSFICGTDTYVYMEYTSGKIFFGRYLTTESSWVLNQYESREAARNALFSAEEDVPWMIIKAD